MKLTFKIFKDTPHAFRYTEVDDAGVRIEDEDKYVIGTLYVRKHAMPERPTMISVEVTPIKGA